MSRVSPLGRWRICVEIGEIEVLEPEVDFTAWEDNDLRNFDGVFGNRAGYLGHQLLDILLWQNAIRAAPERTRWLSR